MKASEFRIGNYITGDKTSSHWVVIQVNKQEIIAEATQNINHQHIVPTSELEGSPEVYGIPLTNDWLVKFGFKDHRILLPGDGELEIRLKGSTFHVWPTDGQTGSHNYMNLVGYVHQLQNLYFALTGEELTIKQP